MQRNSAAFPRKSLEIAAISQLWLPNRTGENVPPNASAKLYRLFLWRAHTESGFNVSTRRMEYDHKPMKDTPRVAG